MRRARITGAIVLWAGVVLPAAARAQSLRTVTLSKQYRDQTPVTTRIEFASGTIQVVPGPAGSLYRMQLSYDADRFLPVSRFDPLTNALQLGLERTGGGGLRVSSSEHLKQQAAIELSPEPAMALAVNLGASRANLELGGLRLNRVILQTTASQTTMRFSTPNPVRCDSLRLNAGATEFSAFQLGNSGCRTVRLDGSVGEVMLDLTGGWKTDADVAISMAFGGLTLRLPRDMGVELTLDRLFSSFEPTGFVHTGSVYRSVGYDQTGRKLRIHLSCKVGNVDVEWEEEGKR